MDPATALINNAPNVVAALSDLDRIGVVSLLILLVIGLWFNQRNMAKALSSLENVVKILAKDLEIRNKSVDGEIKEILTTVKSMDKELFEIKHTCSMKYPHWDSHRYHIEEKGIAHGEHIH